MEILVNENNQTNQNIQNNYNECIYLYRNKPGFD